MPRAAIGALTLVLAALLLSPSVAGAATVSQNASGQMLYQADPGQIDKIQVWRLVSWPYFEVRADLGAYGGTSTLSAVAPCTQVAADKVRCPMTTAGYQINLGDGDDVYTAQDQADPGAHEVFGGSGNDVLVGGYASENLHGGPGDDNLTGAAGVDSLFGDDGNDQLVNDFYFVDPEDLHGGLGEDTAAFGEPAVEVSVSFDDQPNDGRGHGAEGDNVRSDIERWCVTIDDGQPFTHMDCGSADRSTVLVLPFSRPGGPWHLVTRPVVAVAVLAILAALLASRLLAGRRPALS